MAEGTTARCARAVDRQLQAVVGRQARLECPADDGDAPNDRRGQNHEQRADDDPDDESVAPAKWRRRRNEGLATLEVPGSCATLLKLATHDFWKVTEAIAANGRGELADKIAPAYPSCSGRDRG